MQVTSEHGFGVIKKATDTLNFATGSAIGR